MEFFWFRESVSQSVIVVLPLIVLIMAKVPFLSLKKGRKHLPMDWKERVGMSSVALGYFLALRCVQASKRQYSRPETEQYLQ